MNRFLPKPARCRLLGSRLGSLLLLFQKSPVVQMFFPEARLIGGAGVCELGKWTIATVAGLGAFDSVAGATTIAQIAPNAGSSTVDATKGKNLSFVFQLTNYPDTPGSWKVSGLPAGLVHADAKNNSIDSVSGTPTQAGTFSVKVVAYKSSSYSGDSFSRTFTMNVAEDASISITKHPASVSINSGQTATLQVVATGAPPLRYQWYEGATGTTISPVGTNSPVFTTPRLTTTTKYWVKVSNDSNLAGALSQTATVTVKPSPIIALELVPGSALVSGVSKVDFGRAALGTRVVRSFIARNTHATQTITNLAVAVGGPHAGNFILTGPAETSLAPAASTTFSIEFRPSAAGTRSATLQLTSGLAGDLPFAVALAGNAFVPVQDIAVEQPARTNLTDGKSKRSFGNTKVGGKGRTLTFTIRNTGGVNLYGITIAKNGLHARDFIVSPPPRTSLTPKESATFTITFKPRTKGLKTAAIQIRSNDPDENPFDIVLAGQAVP